MSVRIITADVFAGLSQLEDESVQCVVTSPPYWGLRDYGVPGQLGLEPTLGEHLDVMVRLFEEVRRVLRPDGTLWINYGDCYATTPNGRSAAAQKEAGTDDRGFVDKPFSTVGPIQARPNNGEGQHHSRRGGILKPKDLCMVPNRLAIALQEAGWWVRSEVIWGKPNPMPESVTDRPATAHEKIFLLTKSSRYFYDAQEVRQTRTSDEDANGFRGGSYVAGVPGKRQAKGNRQIAPGDYATPTGWDKGAGGHGSIHRNGRTETAKTDKQRGHSRRHAGFNDRWDRMSPEEQRAGGRHLKNYEPPPLQVWRIATRPFRGSHFATFPPELVERCLKAGTRPGDHVLDPFGGAGTTGLVADQMGRDATLIELNPDYVDIAAKRLRTALVPVETTAAKPAPVDGMPLFGLRD